MKEQYQKILIPLFAAIIGGFVGSGFGGYLSHKQWKYERTLDSYSSFLKIFENQKGSFPFLRKQFN